MNEFETAAIGRELAELDRLEQDELALNRIGIPESAGI